MKTISMGVKHFSLQLYKASSLNFGVIAIKPFKGLVVFLFSFKYALTVYSTFVHFSFFKKISG